MKKILNSNIKTKKALTVFIRSINVTVFIVFVLICLIIAVLMLSKTILVADTLAGDNDSNISFDQTTINHISNLRTSSDSVISLPLSSSRNNPFVE
jgi:uncharacterized membrane protein